MKKSWFWALALFLISPCPGNAQFGLGIFKKHTRVKPAPANKSYKLEDEDVELQEGFFTEGERWVVFSDRAANTTYRTPGGEMHIKTLGFMDPCYVIGKKDGYLELARYDPKLLQTPSKGKIGRKGIDYLGWVQQDHLLLWRNALKENSSKFYLKAITCFKNENIFASLPHYAVKDSLLLYGSPILRDAIGRCAVEDLFYIFKQSTDGKQYLLGRSTQIAGDSYKDVAAGWISKDLVKLWGGRSFFTVNDSAKTRPGNNYTNGIAFFADPSNSGPGPTTARPFHLSGTATVPGNILENIFPVQDFIEKNDGSARIKTGVLADVLDRSENEVINVLGKKVRYRDYRKILADQTSTNIVFVVDGGRENGKYLANIPTVIQNLELFFDTSHGIKNFKYGAVVYKDGLGGSCSQPSLPLTPDYHSMVQFFYERQKEINSCNNDTIAQAVFQGIIEASGLLAPFKGQNNIIILIGAAGNNMDHNGYTDAISHLSYVGARLLVFQTHSIPHPAYNDFVIQAKNLVLRSAMNISELKKEKLVDPNDVLNNPSFSLVGGDSGIYYLDHPKNSMVQGYVIFPEKGKAMQPAFLGKGLDSLMQKIYADNRRVERSLTRYFGTIGIRNTRILQPDRFFYPSYDSSYLPIDFLRSVSFASQPFYLPAWVNYQSRIPDSANSIRFGLLLSAEEYEQLVQTLFDLAGDRDYPGSRRRMIYNHLYGVVSKHLSQKKIITDERIGHLSFAEVLGWLTGYRPANPLWDSEELQMIKEDEQMPVGDVLSFLKKCKEKAKWLRQNTNNNQIRFFNNGQAYYWLPASILP